MLDEDNWRTLTKLHIIWNHNVDKFYDAFKEWVMLDTLILKIPDINRDSRDSEVVEFCQNFPNLESVDIQLGITTIAQEPSKVEQLWMDLLKTQERLKFVKYNSINRPKGKLIKFKLSFVINQLRKYSNNMEKIIDEVYIGHARISEFIRKNLQKAFIDITV